MFHSQVQLYATPTREIVTTTTEMEHKTIEGFCGFGRVVEVILQREYVV